MSQFEGLTAGTWVIDPMHSEVGFTVRHLMSKVRGKFERFEGSVVVGDEPDQSVATATIELDSINTGTQQRDDHLRSGDFFGAEVTPQMTFSSTGIKLEGDSIKVTGDLTIKNVTNQVELDVEFLGTGHDHYGGLRAGFEASTVISRKEWGIDFNIPLEGGKLMIGDKITVNLTVEAVLQPQEAEALAV
jgi:polyisoprenoid-binding protein YceI